MKSQKHSVKASFSDLKLKDEKIIKNTPSNFTEYIDDLKDLKNIQDSDAWMDFGHPCELDGVFFVIAQIDQLIRYKFKL